MIRRIRERLKLWMRWLTVPIKAGPLKGMKWIVVSGSNFIRGRYKEFKTSALLHFQKAALICRQKMYLNGLKCEHD